MYLNFRLGRRPAYFIYLLIECIFGIATAFAEDFWMWLFFRIGVGFTVPAILTIPNVLRKDEYIYKIIVNILS